MKFSIIPRYGPWGASSRLRAYTLHESLLKLGHQSVIGYDENADILLIQKSVDGAMMRTAEAFKGLIIYDFDDREVYASLQMWADIADLLITDTEGHARECGYPAKVVPDPIDFCPSAPLPFTEGEGVVWFGHHTNYHAIEETVAYTLGAGIRTRIISSPEVQSMLPVDVEFVRFDMGTFTSELRKSRMAILSHDKGDPFKSNNKMICAITQGLPCVGRTSEEYLKLGLATAGLCFSEQQWYVWDNYHPLVVAKLFLTMLEEL